MHLLLVRHGESFTNLENWEGGNIDTGLTPQGQQQAARLAAWLARYVHVDALYASTLARALETAGPVAEAAHLAVVPDHRVREIGHCHADGSPLRPEELPVTFPPDYWGTECPHLPIRETGESWVLFRERVGEFLDDVLARYRDRADTPEKTVVVVCHNAVISASFDYVFNTGPRYHIKVITPNTGIVHWQHRQLKPGREPWRLLAQGIAYHLHSGDGEWLGTRPACCQAN